MRWLTRLTLAAALTCWAAAPALGADAGSPFGYALAAAGFRSYFVFDSSPGKSVRGTLRVVSLTPAAKTIILAPVDVTTASTGGLQYGDQFPRGDGRWLTLAVRRVRISGGESASVPFTARIPRHAGAGDYFLGITAVDRSVLSRRTTGRGAIRLRLIPRLAMTIKLGLPGRRASKLALGGLRIAVAPSGASLAFRLANLGNTLIPSSSGSITVLQGSTMLFSQDLELAAFVPRTAITYHVPWHGTPVQGTYRVRGELHPAGAPAIVFDRTVTFGRAAIRQFRAQTGRAAKEASGTPVMLIAALALALALATGLGIAYGRARGQIKRSS